MHHDVRLLIDGFEYTGWQQVNFKRSMEALSASFMLRASYTEPFPVSVDAPVELYFDDDKVLSGYISTIDDTIDAGNTRVTIMGRDKTADLIDASAVHDSQEFKNLDFASLLNTIAGPFGISVDVQVSGIEPFKKFSLQQETAFEAIERAARLRGLFLNSDENGNLIVQEFGKQRAAGALVMGDNIEAFTRSSDYTDRFSEYIVRGQQQGSDEENGETASSPEGRAFDLGVSRYRPLIIIAEGNINEGQAEERAQWEATVRAARSDDFLLQVTGWRELDDAGLWSVNKLVPLQVPQRGIDQDMLIREVNYMLSDSTGFVTQLKLSKPDAFQKSPEVPADAV